jgi:hypothetical protein
MPAPKKYPDEPPERATRMAVEARRDLATAPGAIRRRPATIPRSAEWRRHWVSVGPPFGRNVEIEKILRCDSLNDSVLLDGRPIAGRLLRDRRWAAEFLL